MSFITSLYLWILPLVSVPLLIYLFNRNKYKNILFSSIKFLTAINKKSIKRVNLINVLLIIIRTLIILFFILMMSRPFYNSYYNSSRDVSSIALIGIDNSLSMHNVIDKKINNIISEILKPLNKEVKVVIFTLDDFKIISDKKNLETSLQLLNIQKSYNKNSLDKISDLTNDFNNYLNKYLFIVSDGQENLFTKKSTINKEWHVNYINTREKNTNASITKIKSTNQLVLPNDIFQIITNIKNTGTEDIKDLLVELFINEINIGKQYINIQKNSTKKIIFDLSIPYYGEHLGMIKIDDDDIKDDNIFYFTINLNEGEELDVIDEKNNLYLKNILTSFNFKNNVIKPNFYNLESYMDSNIKNNVLFIVGLNNITKKLNSKLNQIGLNDKIKVIIFPSIYDQTFIPLNHILPNINFKDSYRKQIGINQFLEIETKLIKDKNLNSLFSENLSRNIKVFNYISMKSDPNSTIILNNNDMFLNTYKKSKNIEILVSSISLDLNSTNYPLKGNILPFFKSLIMDHELIEFYDNNTVSKKLNNLNKKSILTSPDNQKFTFNSNNDIRLNQLGYYTINNSFQKKYFSLNINENEKISNFLNNNQIKYFLPESSFISSNTKDISANLNRLNIGYDIWKILFIFVLLLIMIEMYISTSLVKND